MTRIVSTHHDPRPRARAAARRRGFTLVELLTVIAMISILAALGVVAYRRYATSAASTEATTIIQSIRGAEEAYNAENKSYLGCSGCGSAGCAPGAGSLSSYYPQLTGIPDAKKWAWSQPAHADYGCWRLLNVTTDGSVRFGYSVVAGAAGGVLPTTALAQQPVWGPTTEPWYLIQAAADRDANGQFAILVAASFMFGSGSGVYSENISE